MKKVKKFKFIGKFIGIVLVALLIVLIVIACKTNLFTNLLNKRIDTVEQNIQFLEKERYPLHFVITERSDLAITGSFAFFDSQNNIIDQSHVFTLDGNELFFDFVVASLDDTTKVAFPYKIFTDTMTPDKGVSISQLYDDNGFPAIFEKSTTATNKRLSEIYEEICSGNVSTNNYGNAVHDTSKIGNFIVGQEYRVLVHTKGGIEIVMGE